MAPQMAHRMASRMSSQMTSWRTSRMTSPMAMRIASRMTAPIASKMASPLSESSISFSLAILLLVYSNNYQNSLSYILSTGCRFPHCLIHLQGCALRYSYVDMFVNSSPKRWLANWDFSSVHLTHLIWKQNIVTSQLICGFIFYKTIFNQKKCKWWPHSKKIAILPRRAQAKCGTLRQNSCEISKRLYL